MSNQIDKLIEKVGTDTSGKWMRIDQVHELAKLIVEECALRSEVYSYMSQNFNALAEELRSMNGESYGRDTKTQ